MKTVDLEGLPEPVADAVVQMVERLREQFRPRPAVRRPVKLHTRPGDVIGSLSRAEIYRDVD